MSDSLQVPIVSTSIQALYKLLKFKDLNGNGEIEKHPDLKAAPAIAKIDPAMVKANMDKKARTEIIKIINEDLKTSYPDTNEGYKEEADINKDGKIVPAEAKLYLLGLKNISPAEKQRFALTEEDRKSLFVLFCGALDNRGASQDPKMSIWQIYHRYFLKKRDIVETIEAMSLAGFDKTEQSTLFKKAVGATKDMNDPREKTDAIKYLAAKIAKAKLGKNVTTELFNEILGIAGTVRFKYFDVLAIKEIAFDMAEAGMDKAEIHKAFQSVKIIIPLYYVKDRENGMNEIISSLVAIGDDKKDLISFFIKALVTAQTIEDPSMQERTVLRMVSCMGLYGIDQNEINNALEEACLTKHDIIRAFKNALAAAGNIKDPQDKERAVGKIRFGMAGAGLSQDEINGIFKEETLKGFGIRMLNKNTVIRRDIAGPNGLKVSSKTADSSLVLNVLPRPRSMYELLGFNDKNHNGVIEEISVLKKVVRAGLDSALVKAGLDKNARNKIIDEALQTTDQNSAEGYKEAADINKDGKIVEAEAKFYLQNMKHISPEDKQRFALTGADRKVLAAIFREALGNAGISSLHSSLKITSLSPDDKGPDIEKIVDAILKAGLDKTQLKALFEQALNEAVTVKAPFSSEMYLRDSQFPISMALMKIASAMDKTGMDKIETSKAFKKAFDIADTTDDPRSKAAAISFIAMEMAKAGMDKAEIRKAFKEAMDAAETIKCTPNSFPCFREQAFMGIAIKMGLAGMDKNETVKPVIKALDAIKLIQDSFFTKEVLTSAASQLAQIKLEKNALSGLFKEVLEIAGTIRSPYTRAFALKAIALDMATAGIEKDEAAFAKAIAIKDTDSNADKAGTDEEEKCNVFEKAMKRAGTIHSQIYAYLFHSMAADMVEAGLDKDRIRKVFKKALETANATPNENEIRYVFAVNKNPNGRAMTIMYLASGMAEAGLDKDEVSKTFKEALATARTIKEPEGKVDVTWEIALEMAKVGMDKIEIYKAYNEALAAAGDISDPGKKADVIGKITIDAEEAGLDKSEIDKTSRDETLKKFGIKIPK